MKTLAISEFKAHALQVLGEVAKTKQKIIITKRGVPIAEVSPYTADKAISGKLSNALIYEEDIISPLGEEIWSACK